MLYIQVKQTSDGMINYSAMAVCWDNGFSVLKILTTEKQAGSYFGSPSEVWFSSAVSHYRITTVNRFHPKKYLYKLDGPTLLGRWMEHGSHSLLQRDLLWCGWKCINRGQRGLAHSFRTTLAQGRVENILYVYIPSLTVNMELQVKTSILIDAELKVTQSKAKKTLTPLFIFSQFSSIYFEIKHKKVCCILVFFC